MSMNPTIESDKQIASDPGVGIGVREFLTGAVFDQSLQNLKSGAPADSACENMQWAHGNMKILADALLNDGNVVGAQGTLQKGKEMESVIDDHCPPPVAAPSPGRMP